MFHYFPRTVGHPVLNAEVKIGIRRNTLDIQRVLRLDVCALGKDVFQRYEQEVQPAHQVLNLRLLRAQLQQMMMMMAMHHKMVMAVQARRLLQL